MPKGHNEIAEASTISIIFSALTAEAFINFYGVTNQSFSKSYFENYLDKLELFSKWVVIPKLVVGKSIDTGCVGMAKLKDLIKKRNELVHYKTKAVSPENFPKVMPPEKLVPINDAQLGVEAIQKCVLELKAIDPSVSTQWIEKIQNQKKL